MHASKLIDKVRIYACGGRGGQGSSKLGGFGGDGGDVIVNAVEGSNLSDIARLEKRRFIGSVGRSGEGCRIHGRKGRHATISVPPGTVVYNCTEEQEVCDLVEAGMEKVLVKGGVGGSHLTPNCHGLPGERGVFVLKLKTIADVGMVGFPNAGKSTLLKALSNATPKIANYPFTTLRPQLGTVFGNGGRSFTIADLPGLVEGAHNNIGMGHRFLQHIERTKLLLYVVDINGFQLSGRHITRDPYESTQLLMNELEMYHTGLGSTRKAVLIVNKMDSPQALEKFQSLHRKLQESVSAYFQCIVGCSALKKVGTEIIKKLLFDLL